MKTGYRLAVDTGGTFTDLCLLDESSGVLVVDKVPSTPSNPSEAVLAGVSRILGRAGADPRHVHFFLHGTTVATNALLERNGAKTALLTTEGFEDVLHIGRQDRPALYDFRARRPEPIVPRALRFGVHERTLHDGQVLRKLDHASAERLVLGLRRFGVESVAVCLLHAYANPSHEKQLKSIVSRHLPDAVVTLSSEVLPEFREYERTSTVCVNAYVAPCVARYVADLEARLETVGISSDLQIMQSNGGIITSEVAREVSARTVLSGPAGGALAGRQLSRVLDRPNLITIDMGGTSSDICLLESGEPRITTESHVGGHPIRLPMIDIHTIGAGGGSIARVDPGGALQVGPRSAGATPGPICYGRGGTVPTVTDANAVLGRLNPKALLGGEMDLCLDRARQGIHDTIARPLDMSTDRAAWGIVEVINAIMVRGIRRVSVERGYDPRTFSLVALGGAGPLHAVALARELGIPEVVVPPRPGIASACGMLSADTRHDLVRTRVCTATEANPDLVARLFDEMEAIAGEQLRREGFAARDRLISRSADLRYFRQAHELEVPLKGPSIRSHTLAEVVKHFHGEHQRIYGHARESEPVEFVNFRVTAVGKIPELPSIPPPCGIIGDPGPSETREVIFDIARVPTPVFQRATLTPDKPFFGPAIIEQMDSTVVIPPGSTATPDRQGNLIILTGADS